MDRRGFLQLLSAGVASIALEQAIPLGRVWSFPKEIVLANQIALPPNASGRFIEGWDQIENCKVLRVDFAGAAFGPLHVPDYFEKAERIIGPPRRASLSREKLPLIPEPLWDCVVKYFREYPLSSDEIRYFHIRVPSSELESASLLLR